MEQSRLGAVLASSTSMFGLAGDFTLTHDVDRLGTLGKQPHTLHIIFSNLLQFFTFSMLHCSLQNAFEKNCLSTHSALEPLAIQESGTL